MDILPNGLTPQADGDGLRSHPSATGPQRLVLKQNRTLTAAWNRAARFVALGLTVLFLASLTLSAATNVGIPRPLPRTNAAPGTQRVPSRTNVVTGAKSSGSKTNAVAANQPFWTKARNQAVDSFNKLKGTKAFYPVIIGVPVCLVFALIFLVRFIKSRSAAKPAGELLPAPSLAAQKVRKTTAKVYACNVLQTGPEAQNLWQFDASSGGFVLNRQQTSLAGENLPQKLVAKSWHTLFQRKLNVAWLPPEQVFLRVAQFPRSDFNETLAMVELQLEKLSPMPVAQIVWSIHILPHSDPNLQTVVLMIVARNIVEEFLGKLEAQGFLADRLEMPMLDQLQATPIHEDGAWIYPDPRADNKTALVAWWYGGVLQNVDLATLPSSQQSSSLKEQLLQMAWAGEMEGWLKSTPHWHLVADAATAAQWEPALREGFEQPVSVSPPLPPAELAALTARRAAHADPRASLLPLEFSTRYQQQFVDRLWMRGLLAVAGLYLIGVAIYAVALGYATFRTRAVEKEVASVAPAYTNAMQLKASYQVLKDRQELKFAALDCWNITARLLPEGATLDNLNFSEGRKLMLTGTAQRDQVKQLYDFESEMRRAPASNGEPMFDPLAGEHINFPRYSGNMATWNLSLLLKRSEVQ